MSPIDDPVTAWLRRNDPEMLERLNAMLVKQTTTNWPWTEREVDDDKNSDAETSLPVRETV